MGVQRTVWTSGMQPCASKSPEIFFSKKKLEKTDIPHSPPYQNCAPHGQVVMYTGDADHRDYVTIPGAKIPQLHDAFVIEYAKEMRGMDVVLVAGLNDVARGYSREYIMYCIKDMRKAVNKQAELYHPHVKNTFAVATMLYPPQLVWFEDNGPVPYPDYHNNREKLDWINGQIMADNIENGVQFAPKLHTYGVRTDNKERRDRYGNVTVRHTKSHRWGEWRERNPADMLHLNNARRVALGKDINKYFNKCTS